MATSLAFRPPPSSPTRFPCRAPRVPFVLALPLALAMLVVVAQPAMADPLDPTSYSSLGTLIPGADVTIDTTADPPTMSGGATFTGVTDNGISVFCFALVNVPAGITITASGSRPVAILSQSSLTFDGTFNANGNPGSDGFAGSGGPGGFSGNHGGPGGGPGGGFDPTGNYVFEGSGGGFGTRGGDAAPMIGGSTYGDLYLALQGGSGGTGMLNHGGGGGGGGAVELGAVNFVSITGTVNAKGGRGGDGQFFDPLGFVEFGGGGGSGGGVIVHSTTSVQIDGTIDVSGGGASVGIIPGAGGGAGRILLHATTITVNGTLAGGGPQGLNDEAPVVTASQSFAIPENSAVASNVGTVVATDADDSTLQNFTITGGNIGGAFAINSSTGQITVAAALDRETLASYNLTVTVSDGFFTSAGETVTITLNDVNDNTPVVTASQSFNIFENRTVGTSVGTVLATDADSSFTPQNWTITGGNTGNAFAINGSTGEITVATPAAVDFETNPSFTLTVTVSDGTHTSAAETVTVTLTNINDAPTVTASDPPAVNEDAGVQSITGWATFDPVESGQVVNTVVTNNVSNPGLFASQPSVNTSGNLVYVPAANANGTSTFGVWVQDNGGIANGGSDTSIVYTFTITVNAVNDAPSFTVAGNPASVNEDAGPQTVNGWASFTAGPANESGQSVQQYIVSNLSNAALFSAAPAVDASGNLTYTPAANANGTCTFDVAVQDNGDTANGGSDTSATQTFTITVNAVNDAPSAIASDPAAVDEDAGAQTVNGWASFSAGPADESAQSNLGYTVSNVSNPALFSAAPAVDASGNLTFTPAANANGTSTFDVSVQDNGGTANGGSDTSTPHTYTITVNAVNDAPVLSDTALALAGGFFGDPAPSGAVGTLVNALVSVGGNVSDPDTGAVAGIAITAIDSTNGTWHYSTDDGASWSAFGAVSDANARLLAADADNRIYFQPANGFSGSIDPGITFRAWDTTSGTDGLTADASTNGGATAFSSATDTASISIAATADIDVQWPAGTSVAENSTQTLTGTKPLNTPFAVTYTIRNTGNATLNLTGTPLVEITFTHHATASITALPTASLAPNASTTFTVTITPGTPSGFQVRLQIATNDPNESPFRLTIDGTGANAPQLGVSRGGATIAVNGTHTLGNAPMNAATTFTFTAANTGQSTLTFDGTPLAISGEFNASASIGTNLPATLAASASADFTIEITPASAGTFRVVLTIASDDPTNGSFVFTVSGTATSGGTAPEIAVERIPGVWLSSGGTVNLGTLTTGAARDVNFTVRNQGTADLVMQATQVTGETNATVSVTTDATSPISSGTSSTVTVSVNPVADGAFEFMLTLPSNDADEANFTLTVSGTASATTAPEIRVYRQGAGELTDAGTDAIGGVTAGETRSLTYVIENAGNAALTIDGAALSALTNATGAITALPATSIAAGDTTTFTVALTPTNAGAVTATLQIESSDADENPFTVTIDSAGQVAKFELLRNGLLVGATDDVSSLAADGAIHAITYTVRNAGTGTLHLLSPPKVASESNVSVRLDSPAWTQLAPGESATFTAFLDIAKKSDFSAVVSIETSDPDIGTASFTITGNGENGISISCGALADSADPLAPLGLLILLAMLGLARLRRVAH